MIDLLIYNRDSRIRDVVGSYVSNTVAMLSNERLTTTGIGDPAQVDTCLDDDKPYDLSVLEVSNDSDIRLSARVRAGRQDSDIMLVAESSISPMKYLTPDIRACSLLLKPYEDETLKSVVNDFVAAFFRKRTAPDDRNCVVIESREGKVVVPYSQIYYIEIRNKKVIFRLRDREYSKYDTLDNIKKDLPPAFVQTHRSYIINTSYISMVRLSENAVYLENDIIVPLSRSYKSVIKEYLRGVSGK